MFGCMRSLVLARIGVLRGERIGLELSFVDKGPGIADLQKALGGRLQHCKFPWAGLVWNEASGGRIPHRNRGRARDNDRHSQMEKRFLIARWLGSDIPSIPIYDEASVSSARQRVRDAGLTFNASKDLVETVALMASELTHNQLAYARQGYFGVRPIERGSIKGLEILAADLGPGFEKRVLTGSPQTEDSLGAGLESVFRLADEVEIDTRRAEGLRVIARKFETQTSSLVRSRHCWNALSRRSH